MKAAAIIIILLVLIFGSIREDLPEFFRRLCQFVLGASIYFLPTYIARNKKNYNAIALLNLLTGWTGIGWIISIVWAATKD